MSNIKNLLMQMLEEDAAIAKRRAKLFAQAEDLTPEELLEAQMDHLRSDVREEVEDYAE